MNRQDQEGDQRPSSHPLYGVVVPLTAHKRHQAAVEAAREPAAREMEPTRMTDPHLPRRVQRAGTVLAVALLIVWLVAWPIGTTWVQYDMTGVFRIRFGLRAEVFILAMSTAALVYGGSRALAIGIRLEAAARRLSQAAGPQAPLGGTDMARVQVSALNAEIDRAVGRLADAESQIRQQVRTLDSVGKALEQGAARGREQIEEGRAALMTLTEEISREANRAADAIAAQTAHALSGSTDRQDSRADALLGREEELAAQMLRLAEVQQKSLEGHTALASAIEGHFDSLISTRSDLAAKDAEIADQMEATARRVEDAQALLAEQATRLDALMREQRERAERLALALSVQVARAHDLDRAMPAPAPPPAPVIAALPAPQTVPTPMPARVAAAPVVEVPPPTPVVPPPPAPPLPSPDALLAAAPVAPDADDDAYSRGPVPSADARKRVAWKDLLAAATPTAPTLLPPAATADPAALRRAAEQAGPPDSAAPAPPSEAPVQTTYTWTFGTTAGAPKAAPAAMANAKPAPAPPPPAAPTSSATAPGAGSGDMLAPVRPPLAPAPTAPAPAPSSRAPTAMPTAIGRLITRVQNFSLVMQTQLFDGPTHHELDRFEAGERQIFARQLIARDGETLRALIIAEVDRNPVFEERIGEFLRDFDTILEPLSGEAGGDAAIEAYLTSPIGRLYIIVGSAVGHFR